MRSWASTESVNCGRCPWSCCGTTSAIAAITCGSCRRASTTGLWCRNRKQNPSHTKRPSPGTWKIRRFYPEPPLRRIGVIVTESFGNRSDRRQIRSSNPPKVGRCGSRPSRPGRPWEGCIPSLNQRHSVTPARRGMRMTSTPAPIVSPHEGESLNPFARAVRPRGLCRWLPGLALVSTYQRSWLVKGVPATACAAI